MRRPAFVALLALLPAALPAARLILRDGTVIYGDFISGTPSTVIFRDHNGVRRRFAVDEVRTLDFGTPHGAPVNSAAGSAGRAASDVVTVRTDASIDDGDAATGARFLATVSENVMDDSGKVVIPAGSRATLVVRHAGSSAGAGYVVELDSVRVNGKWYVVNATAANPPADSLEIQFRLQQPLRFAETTP
jgi:hypothetical protein